MNMKRAKLLISALMLLAVTAIGQPQLHWRFANPTTFTSGPDCIMQFDVELSCDVATTYHSSMMIYFDYNPAVFGNTIVANNKITYTRGTLMDLDVFGSPGYSWVNHADNTPQRYAITTEANFLVANPMFMEEVPLFPTFATFAQFQIVIGTPGLAGIAFTPNTGAPTFVGLMDGNQFYIDGTHPAETPYGMAPAYAGFYDNDLLTFDASCPIIPTDYTWTGAVSTDWFTAGNWDSGMVPTMTDNVIIPDVANDPMLMMGMIGYAQNVTIATGATLTIAYTDAFEASGVVTNDGSINVYGDAVSGAMGSFIDNGLAGMGYFMIERPIVSWTNVWNAPNGWHYITSPVNGLSNLTVAGDYWINAYDETAGLFYDYAPGGDIPCVTGADNPWMAGYGYSLKWCETCGPCPTHTGTTIEFAGTIGAVNTGNVAVPVTANNTGWNLVGNPYPSTWDYEAWFANNAGTTLVDDAIYFWDDVNLQYAAWVFGSGVNGGSRYVQPGQGFFWHTTAADVVTFANNERVSTPAPYWKSNDNLVNLQVSGNGYKDQTVIRFMNDATIGFDGDFDAYKLVSVDFVPSLYTGSGEAIMSINSQPATEMVPMSFQTSTSGTYTIEAIETGAFANVVLEDLVTGEQTNLLTDSYTFSYTTGENAARFIVHFTPLGSPELEANSIQIYANNSNIVVNVPANVKGQAVVYNVVGQEIANVAVEGGINTLTVSDVNTVYIVKVMANNSVVTEKVYIK
jgi:hypothetical protein